MTSNPEMSGRRERERVDHDRLAASLSAELMIPIALDRPDTDLLASAGTLNGLRVLDYGCGSGDIALELVNHGAIVSALDLSPGMIEVAERRMTIHRPGRECTFVASPAEETPFADQAFDLIIGRYILHHLEVDAAALEVARLLAPGGRAVFLETWGHSPLLRFARNHLAGRFGIPRLGTVDERPLVPRDLSSFKRHFLDVKATHPYFSFFRIFDRQVLRYRFSALNGVLRRADEVVERRFPGAGSWSFFVLLELANPIPQPHPAGASGA